MEHSNTPHRRFIGVRQRPSGRWVAEIKNSTQPARLWLGTYNTPEEAARAYDKAACILRGENTRTNFSVSSADVKYLSATSKVSGKLHGIIARTIGRSKSLAMATGGIGDNAWTKNWLRIVQPSFVVPSSRVKRFNVASSVIVPPSFSQFDEFNGEDDINGVM